MRKATKQITLKIETSTMGTRTATFKTEKAAALYEELWKREGHKVTRI